MAAHPATVVRTPGVLREAPATGPLANPGVARLVGFVPLAGFGALQWGALLTPKADGSLLLGGLAAAAAGGAPPPPPRPPPAPSCSRPVATRATGSARRARSARPSA